MKPPETGSRPDPARVEQLFHEALQVPADEQDAFLARTCPADRALRHAVRSLLAAGRNAATAWERTAMELEARHSAFDSRPARAGETFGPYRILRPIAAGGMSFVYEAMRDDAEFHKRVAIKFLQQGFNEAAGVERFRSERQILAQLEHPHIARLLDGGTTQDGVPYLVMEYVDGAPIDEFVREQRPPRAARLKLFLQVSEAVQYAHRNLVVHRDLKPGNILVTRPGPGDPGVPKLLDFGIAKLLTAESGAPATTIRALTPEYASPEQVLGRSITTATDVYSLGVLLFVMLAERLPYRASSADTAGLVRAICEEEPAWDSGGLGLIEGDLQNILAQALRKEPERRYLSVEQFADDIRRYLAGLPVSARPDTLFYRARKFAVRRAIPLAASVALVVAVLAGLAGSLWQARRAEQQRLIAQRRFDDARRLVYTVIHDIQPKLAAIDGTVTLRKTLIEKTLVYLEALSRDAADSPALLRELLDSYSALAEVAAGTGTANVGDYRGAGEILRRAEALAGTLLKIDPSNPASVRSLIEFYRVTARYHLDYGSEETGRSYARRGLEMAERLAASSPQDGFAREEVAKAAYTLASALADATTNSPDNSNRQRALFERALFIWRDLLQHQPSNADEVRRNIGLVDKSLAGIWSEIGNYPRALEYGVEAREIDREFLARNPSSPAAQMDLAFDIGSVGWTYYLMKDYRKAAENMRENVALRDRVAAADPNDRRAADRLAYALRDLAQTEALLGKSGAAVRDYLRSIDLYTQILKTAPLNPQSLFRFAESAFDLGEIDRRQGATGKGCRWFRRSIELLDEYERKVGVSPPVAAEIAEMRRAALPCRQ